MRNGRSFIDCPHKNVQAFTECCLDCGYNIWTTEAEYLEELRLKTKSTSPTVEEIRKLEKKLKDGE
jgi:hypothetical protein